MLLYIQYDDLLVLDHLKLQLGLQGAVIRFNPTSQPPFSFALSSLPPPLFASLYLAFF